MRLYPQPTLARSKGTASHVRLIEHPIIGDYAVRTVLRCTICVRSTFAAEGQLHNVTARLDRSRRDIPCLLCLLIETAVHRPPRGTRPLRVAHARIRDARIGDGHDHGDVAAEGWVRLLPKLRVAKP